MKINFFAPINNLGYGVHAYNTIREFEKRGNQIVLFTPNDHVGFSNDRINEWILNQRFFSAKNPSIMIYHENFLPRFSGSPRIGFPVFEMELFNPYQLAGLMSCDFLFTATNWGKKILGSHGFENVHVVNEGFDPDLFPYLEASKNDVYTFCHVGKCEERKGTSQVLSCFIRAMDGKDAKLIMAVDNPFDPNAVISLKRYLTDQGFFSSHGHIFRKEGLAVEFVSFAMDHNIVSKIFSVSDCGVFPSRAEGWGLPILECLASGVPAIAGRWTGMTEYLPKNSYANFSVMSKEVVADDGRWFRGDRGTWRVMSDDDLIYLMKDNYENSRDRRAMGEWRNLVFDHFRKFTWERSARQLDEALGKIL